MAFSPAHSIGGGVSLAHHKSVYLSRETGYDVTFVLGAPSLIDPNYQIHSHVTVKREDGICVNIYCSDEMDLAVIVRDIKNIKWPEPVTPRCIDRPSPDMVEYIIQFKKEQEEQRYESKKCI